MNGDDTKRLFEAIGGLQATAQATEKAVERLRQDVRDDIKTIHRRIDKLRDETGAQLGEHAKSIGKVAARQSEDTGGAKAKKAMATAGIGLVGGGLGAGFVNRLIDWLGR